MINYMLVLPYQPSTTNDGDGPERQTGDPAELAALARLPDG